MTTLRFFFELASTYSYLSAMRIDDICQSHGVDAEWTPFLLGPIFRAQGYDSSPFVAYPVKGRYMWRDMERLAMRYGVPFRPPGETDMARFPSRTVTASRLALVGLQEGWGKAFVKGVYQAQFANWRDIDNATVLTEQIERAGGNASDAFGRIQSVEIKDRLRANTEAADAAGVFGAPSFVAADELFWGDDRLEQAVDWALAAHAK